MAFLTSINQCTRPWNIARLRACWGKLGSHGKLHRANFSEVKVPRWPLLTLPGLTLIMEAQIAAEPKGFPCLYSLALEWADSDHCSSVWVICLQIHSFNPRCRLSPLPPSSLCFPFSVASTRNPYDSSQSGSESSRTQARGLCGVLSNSRPPHNETIHSRSRAHSKILFQKSDF